MSRQGTFFPAASCTCSSCSGMRLQAEPPAYARPPPSSKATVPASAYGESTEDTARNLEAALSRSNRPATGALHPMARVRCPRARGASRVLWCFSLCDVMPFARMDAQLSRRVRHCLCSPVSTSTNSRHFSSQLSKLSTLLSLREAAFTPSFT